MIKSVCNHGSPACQEVTVHVCDCGVILWDGVEYHQAPNRAAVQSTSALTDAAVTKLTEIAQQLPREQAATLLQAAFVLCTSPTDELACRGALCQAGRCQPVTPEPPPTM